MASSAVEQLVAIALSAADTDTAKPHERVEMLVDIAMSLQHRPTNAEHALGAFELYERALALCTPGDQLIVARIHARMGTALALAR